MDQKNERKWGVLLSYAIMGANILIQLGFTPFLLNVLGQSEYGLYTLVGSVTGYLTLCGFGITSSYLRFHACYAQRKKDKTASLNGVFAVMCALSSLAAILIGMIFVVKSDWILGRQLTAAQMQQGQRLMLVLVLNVALSFPLGLLDSIIISEERFLIQRSVKLLSVVCNPLLVSILLLSGSGSMALVSVTLLLSFISCLVEWYYVKRKMRVRFAFTGFEKGLMQQICVFSFFIFLNMIIDQINWNVDKLILGRIYGTMAVAVYGVAAQINSMYTQCSSAVAAVYAPQVNKLLSTDNADGMKACNQLFVQVGRVQFFIQALLLSEIIFFGGDFIHLWVGDGYREAYWVALLLMIPAFVPLIQNLSIEIQRAKNQHHVRSVVYLIASILNVLVSIPLCRRYGVVGVAMGTAISMLLCHGLFMNYYYHFRLGLDVIQFWKAMLHIVPALMLPVLAGMGLRALHLPKTWLCFLAQAGIYFVLYVLSMWKWGLTPDEKQQAIRMVKKR